MLGIYSSCMLCYFYLGDYESMIKICRQAEEYLNNIGSINVPETQVEYYKNMIALLKTIYEKDYIKAQGKINLLNNIDSSNKDLNLSQMVDLVQIYIWIKTGNIEEARKSISMFRSENKTAYIIYVQIIYA